MMSEDKGKGGFSELEKAFQDAMNFNISNVREMNDFSEEQIRKCVEEEVSSGRVDVQGNGMTIGMSSVVAEPVHRITDAWENLRSKFIAALQPKIADIEAVDKLYNEVAKIKEKRDEKLKSLDDVESENSEKGNIFEDYKRSKTRYDEFRNKYRDRDAVMFSKSVFYWVVLFLILLLEGLINYRVFESFWARPTVALGTTITLGLLLAMAAQQHGELMKQWSYRFARSKPAVEKANSWRMLAMSSLALTIVLLFSGWSRWTVGVASIQSRLGAHGSSLDAVGGVHVNSIREVMIGLVANMGVWMLGVIISYIGHDRDPDYMDATQQFHKHRESWEKVRKILQAEREQVTAAAAEAIKAKENEAEARLKGVKDAYDMKVGMEERDKVIKEETEKCVIRNMDLYKSILINTVKGKEGSLSYFEEGTGRMLPSPEFERMAVAYDKMG